MLSPNTCVVVLVLSASVCIVLKSYAWMRSAMRYLPGPPNSSWVYGNLKEMWSSEHPSLHEAWLARYGPVIKYKAYLNTNRLLTVDLKALNHVLMNATNYPKIPQQRWMLARVVGEGLIYVEGEAHRKQRRAMNPAFGLPQIRGLTEIFVEQSEKLRDFWMKQLSGSHDSTRIDIFDGLSKTTLNTIGVAGFNYDFDALNPSKNEINEAFSTIFTTSDGGLPIWPIMQAYIPPLRLIETSRTRRANHAQETMRNIGLRLVAEKRAAIVESFGGEGKTGIGKDLGARDLLTLLIKSNMAADVPEHLRLSEEEVLGQVPTFLIAGHETTATATTWCLFALAKARRVQQKLRGELFTLPSGTATMDELNALPYLDLVIRETLRLHAPVSSTIKQAVKDDVLPLSTPYVDTRGQIHNSLKIEQGTNIVIPILVINRSKELWGENALEFYPERWQSPPDTVSGIPGVWSNMLTFIGGPRSCIGYRFTIIEMKVLLFTLLRAFEFELAVPAEEIKKSSLIVQRPMVTSEMERGCQLPLLIRRHQRV